MANEIYNRNATKLVEDVLPVKELNEMVNIFMIDAGINMGSDFTDNTLERAVQIVSENFRFLPVCYIASAFKKGSLGSYGPGRLVPRTIFTWLNEITLEWNRDQAHERLTATPEYVHFKDLEKFPLGKAINRKIEWYKKGLLDMRDWDKIPLKELAEREGKGLHSAPELFGIKSNKT